MAPWEILEGMLCGVVAAEPVHDATGTIVDFRFVYANAEACQLSETSREMFVSTTLLQRFPVNRTNGVFEIYRDVATDGIPRDTELAGSRGLAIGGTLRLHVERHHGALVVAYRDATEEVLLDTYATVLEDIAGRISLQDTLARIIELVETRLADSHGVALLLDEDPVTARAGDNEASLHRVGTHQDQSPDPQEWTKRIQERAGREGWASCWMAPIQRRGDELHGWIVALFAEPQQPIRPSQRAVLDAAARLADVAIERDHALGDLAWSTRHDVLTGLPNRLTFLDRLTQILDLAKRKKRSVLVGVVDLDNFKSANEGRGHGLGDALLVTLGERMQRACRPGDVVARLAGDQFAIAISDVTDQDEARTRVQGMLTDVLRAIAVGSDVFELTACLGIAWGQEPWTTPERVLHDADSAMAAAKQHGRGQTATFEEWMGNQVLDRHETTQQLRQGIARDEFEVFYQPKVRLDDDVVAGMEALARWRHPTRGLLTPNHFIALAEQHGLIQRLGRRIFELACADLGRLSEAAGHPLELAVNLSVEQLADPSLPEDYLAIIAAAGIDPRRICLEVTESAYLGDTVTSAASLQTLHEAGVRLAIDDFGTGYSSMLYLRQLPISDLKLDLRFVQGMSEDRVDGAIIDGILHMAHMMLLDTIAEGVETAEQADTLATLGCLYGQGYHYSPPLPAAEFEAWLRARRR